MSDNYIPINYDLSNLIEKIEWVKTHDEEAKKIAETYFSTEYQKKHLKENIEKYCFQNNKIIDCFTFYNEMDLLFYRLMIFYQMVVIVNKHFH